MTDTFKVIVTGGAYDRRPEKLPFGMTVITPTGGMETRRVDLPKAPGTLGDYALAKLLEWYPGHKGRAHGEYEMFHSSHENGSFVAIFAVDFDTVICTCNDPKKAGSNKADGSHWIACPVHDLDDQGNALGNKYNRL